MEIAQFSCMVSIPDFGLDLNGSTSHTTNVPVVLKTSVPKALPGPSVDQFSVSEHIEGHADML